MSSIALIINDNTTLYVNLLLRIVWQKNRVWARVLPIDWYYQSP